MPGIVADMDTKQNFESFSAGAKFKEYGHGEDSGGASGGGGGGHKKNKKSFLQKAKKFGKQGKLGRGHHVDEETYQYFVRVLELFTKNEFDSDEERELFAGNSLSQAEGSEVQLSSNQLISRVLENILPLASEDSVNQFCKAFTPSLRVIVSDPFASHVLEKLLVITSSDKWLESSTLTTWFENTSRYILNNFEDFTFETHGSFVMKKVLECLSGFVEAPTVGLQGQPVTKKKNNLQDFLYGERKRNLPREKMLTDFAERFSAWPQFNDLVHKDVTSRLIQNVIQAVHRTKGSEELVKDIITRVLNAVTVPFEATDPANRIVEVSLEAADPDTYKFMYEKYYKGSLETYVVGPCFTLQKIISSVPNDDCFEDIFDEVAPLFETLVHGGKCSVIYHLGLQCIKLKSKQKEFWQLLKETVSSMPMHYSEEESNTKSESNLIMKVLTLGKDEQNSTGKTKGQFCTYFGAHTVELLFDFDRPSSVLKSVSELDTKQLMKIALDFKGSYVLSKLFTSSNVPQKQKVKLLTTIGDNLVQLGITKSGSRVIDDIWDWAELPQKAIVAEKLSQRIPLLSANKFGHFLVSKCGLQAFQKDRKEWSEHMGSISKKKKAAMDIAAELGLNADLGLPEVSKKSKKRKSNDDVVKTEEADVEHETPKKKSKKAKQIDDEDDADQQSEEAETKSKGKKHKKKKIELELTMEDSQNEVGLDDEHSKTPKSRKHKHRKQEEVNPELSEILDLVETPKKKKHRKSIQSEDNVVNMEQEEDVEESKTPKKKKHRKSAQTEHTDVQIEPEEIETESKTPKKKKSKKSLHAEDEDTSKVEDVETEIQTPKKKKSKKSKDSEHVETEPDHNDPSNEISKKKKHRKSKSAENNDAYEQPEEIEETETPKKKKKHRKSQ